MIHQGSPRGRSANLPVPAATHIPLANPLCQTDVCQDDKLNRHGKRGGLHSGTPTGSVNPTVLAWIEKQADQSAKYSRRTTNEQPENQYCCYGCRECSCSDWQTARSWHCCSKSHHAAHDSLNFPGSQNENLMKMLTHSMSVR